MPGRTVRADGHENVLTLTAEDVEEQRIRADLIMEYERIASQSVIRTMRMHEQLARERRLLADNLVRLVRIWSNCECPKILE